MASPIDDVIRHRVAAAPVARLATLTPAGTPHLVPMVFALADQQIVSCIDHKPKRTNRLRRLANIAANPAVSVLVDHYDDDWDALWWVRVDGRAEVIDAGTSLGARSIDALAQKYPQYRRRRPEGPVIVIRSLRWRSWSAQS